MNFQFLNHPIYHGIKQMWVNNGRELQSQYGEKKNNGFGSVSVLFDNPQFTSTPNFFTKETVEYLLQKNKKVNSSPKKNIDDLLIYLGTWNVAGLCFSENTHISDWLVPFKFERTPDIYLIGFQEIVDLNPKNIMFYSNTERVDYWKMIISKNLNKVGK